MEWVILAAVAVGALLWWKSSSKKGERNVAAVLANALRNNQIRAISNDGDAQRIAVAWVNEAPPRFNHGSVGGIEIRSTSIGEAFFILSSRIEKNRPPHIDYEKACVAFLLLLTDRENVAAHMTAFDGECRTAAARAVADTGGFQ